MSTNNKKSKRTRFRSKSLIHFKSDDKIDLNGIEFNKINRRNNYENVKNKIRKHRSYDNKMQQDLDERHNQFENDMKILREGWNEFVKSYRKSKISLMNTKKNWNEKMGFNNSLNKNDINKITENINKCLFLWKYMTCLPPKQGRV